MAGIEYQKGVGKVDYDPQVFFNRVLKSLPESAIEFGCHDGRNLKALKKMGVNDLAGVEINGYVARSIPDFVETHVKSILEFESERQWELAFTKGLFIHIHPDNLIDALLSLYNASSKYILIAEYYYKSLKEKNDVTWEGPYPEIIMKACPSLSVKDYGFIWWGDKELPMQNVTWFLLEK